MLGKYSSLLCLFVKKLCKKDGKMFCRDNMTYYLCTNNKPRNMRKLILALCILLPFTSIGVTPQPATGTKYSVKFKYVNTKMEQHKVSRMPVAPLCAFLCGNRLEFESYLCGSIIILYINNIEIFSATIDENGIVEFPNELNGEFELRLYNGEKLYVSNISL